MKFYRLRVSGIFLARCTPRENERMRDQLKPMMGENPLPCIPMKPFLKNGVPVGQHISRKSDDISSPVFLCWCDFCASVGTVIWTPDGQSHLGQSFNSERAAREHLAMMRSAARAFALRDVEPTPMAELVGFSTPPQVASSVSYPLHLNSEAGFAPGEDHPSEVGATSLTSELQRHELQCEWRELEAISSRLQSIKSEPLRFWNPAEVNFKSDLNEADFDRSVSLFSVASSITANSLLLGHIDWLQDTRATLHRFERIAQLSNRFSCKLKVVSRCLEEVESLTRANLRAEWIQRQRNPQERIQITGKEAHINIYMKAISNFLFQLFLLETFILQIGFSLFCFSP